MNVTPPPIHIVTNDSRPVKTVRDQLPSHPAKKAMIAIVGLWFIVSAIAFVLSFFGAYRIGIDLQDGRYLLGSTIYSPGRMFSLAISEGFSSVIWVSMFFVFALIACFALWFATSEKTIHSR